ncbi:MAG: LAGLIDADG family homing endonuclease [Candidatus Woesearchaeota archaeon]
MKNKKSSYTCHSLPEYELAMKLRKERGWGEKKICQELLKYGYPTKPGAVIGWIRYNKKPFNHRLITQIPESSKELTLEKAYIMGTLCGDGYISTGYRLGLDVCDEDFADYFQCCLETVYNIKCSKTVRKRKSFSFTPTPKPQYCIMLVSKLVVLDLNQYTPSFKTFEWAVPEEIKMASPEIQAMFIKGFADSEGSVKNRHRNREIVLTSGNSRGIKAIQKLLLDTFKINAYLVKRNDTVFLLYISDYKSLDLFQKNIGFIIKRKQEKLEAGLKRYKRKGIRKYSPGIKHLALDMLRHGMNHQEIGKLLNTSYANIHDWEKAAKDPDYYHKRWVKWKDKN